MPETVFTNLPPKTIVLNFQENYDNLIVSYNTKNKNDKITIPLPIDKLNRMVIAINKIIINTCSCGASENYPQIKTFKWFSNEVYNILIKPLESIIDGNSYLYIKTGEILNNLPFCALIDDEGKYFIRRWPRLTIAYLSNYVKLKIISNKHYILKKEKRPLIFTNSSSELKYSDYEGFKIKNLFSNGNLYRTEWTHKDILKRIIKFYSILHISCHSFLDNKDYDLSYILLKDEHGNFAKLRTSEIEKMNLKNLELAVLATCKSGVSDCFNSNSSISSAFLKAGAKSALSTLWDISDKYTQPLIRTFYTLLNLPEKDISPATALLRAQQHYIKTNASPYSWAAFKIEI
ncbi:CHAT domain-containing protein [Candidatus Dependentiae bacterium]|nr:CHAT domain-containing protein [Candidatus Dependentiae bacterium]